MELHLRPLTRDQSEDFIRKWYRSVETGLPLHDRAQAELAAQERAEALITRLRAADFRAARVVEMLRNPLLLFNLCLVHRDRGDLPRDRVRLYEECIEVLLERWREGQGMKLSISAKSGRRVLQPAALWLHEKEDRLRATSEELASVLQPALEAVQWKGSDAATFLGAVRDESGLLTGFGQNEYGFMHLGFQEFLAACEIRRRHFEGDPDVLREVAARYGQSWWQEVILILLALGNPSLFAPFMREVVKREAFALDAELLELIFEDALEVSATPFVELLRQAPGEDRGLWARQMIALRLLARRFPPAIDAEVLQVAGHPSAELRAWLNARSVAHARTARPEEVIVTERGGVELLLIPGGTFMMGSPALEQGRDDNEGPQHQVTLSSFYLGRYPVTNEEYGRFLKAHADAAEPARWGDRRFNQARQPVTGVSWDDAKRFAQWAGGRLPTEAEWEYACRAGIPASRHGELAEIAWYKENSGDQPHPVGEKVANAYGLHDMLGNGREWCSDWYGDYSSPPVFDPPGPAVGSLHVIRGSAWYDDARHVRAATRSTFALGLRRVYLGFRLARGQAQHAERCGGGAAGASGGVGAGRA